MGLLASAYFYPYAFMQIPSGLLSDSWGPRKTITSFFILAGAASIAFGLASSAGFAIVARVLVGAGVAMFFVPIMKILTRWFTIKEFSFMTGLIMTTGGIGALTAATPLACMSSLVGWRGSFIGIGVITLFSALMIWIFVRNSPEELNYPKIGAGNSPPNQSPSSLALWDAMKSVVWSNRFWPISLWYFFNFGIFFSFGGLWGGPYLMDVYELTKPQAGYILSMMAVGIIAGSPAFSYLSDHIFKSRKIVLIFSSLCMLFLVVLIALRPSGIPIWLFYIWCFAFGVFGCASSVIGFAATKESFPLSITGTAMGLVNGFPFLGAALAQPLIGLILDSYGKPMEGYPVEAYCHAFWYYVVFAVIALVSACCVHETYNKQK